MLDLGVPATTGSATSVTSPKKKIPLNRSLFKYKSHPVMRAGQAPWLCSLYDGCGFVKLLRSLKSPELATQGSGCIADACAPFPHLVSLAVLVFAFVLPPH